MEKRKFRQTLLIVAFGVSLFAALMNLNVVYNFFIEAIDLILPIIYGLVLAFVLSVPVKGIEKLLSKAFSKAKHKPSGKTTSFISLILTLGIIVLILVAVCTLLIPRLIETVKSIWGLIEKNIPTWTAFLSEQGVDVSSITKWFSSFDIQQSIDKLASSAGLVLGSIADVAKATVSGVATAVISVIIAVYVIMSRETLSRHATKLIYANLKTTVADKICYVARLVRATYTKFLSGQCIEAFILGGLMYIAFLIFKVPYAELGALVTVICAFIPYVGAFLACAISTLLSLLVSPQQAVICLIVYNVVQFIETQFIYPQVVGGSVGLSPMWTLIAAMIGGKLFGIGGMIFFIPLAAVVYTLLKEDTNQKLQKKQIFEPKEEVSHENQ